MPALKNASVISEFNPIPVITVWELIVSVHEEMWLQLYLNLRIKTDVVS
jgi:hypothetical protein